MISIAPATLDDSASIVALWNAKRLDAASCWHTADAIDESYVSQLLAAGMQLAMARMDGVPSGFGLWCASSGSARLVALAADDPAVYYHLMGAYCAWGAAAEFTAGFAELGAAITTERTRMDALDVIQYVTIGFEPLPPGQSAEQRVPRLLRAECELTVLAQAVASVLEGLS
jgi:hypothetical protein